MNWEPTANQMRAARTVVERVISLRHDILTRYERPGTVQVDPATYRDLTVTDDNPTGAPILVYAHPFPRICGLDVHPNPSLRRGDVAVTVLP